MDDDARAELDALRRRAYGPDADIAADPEALARLTALEGLARAERTTSRPDPASPTPATDQLADAMGPHAARAPARPLAAGEDGAAVGPADPDSAGEDESVDGLADADAARPSPRRRRTRMLLGVAGAALLATLATATVVTLTRSEDVLSAADPLPTALPLTQTEVIERIPVEGPYGNSMTIRYSDNWPEIPVSGTVDWASFLGEQFGWELWIYGIEAEPSREHCLLLERHGNVRFACAPVADAAQGQLHLELPIEEIAVARRVVGADRLDFQWRADGVVTVSAVTAP